MSIVNTIYTRAQTISGVVVHKKGVRQFHENELPGISVYRGPNVVDDVAEGASGYLMNLQVIVEYHKKASSDPDDDFVSMVAAIRSAVELMGDEYLDGQLCEPLELAGIEQPELPDDAGGLVAAQVLYSAKHFSSYGG